VIAIINPNNGEDPTPNDDYIVGLNLLKDNQVKQIGYIYSEYGERDINEVKEKIDNYDQNYSPYGVSGIFIDEASNNIGDVTYYKEIYDYAKAKPNLDLVVLNPGCSFDESYLSEPAGDIIVLYESFGSGWEEATISDFVADYDSDKFSLLLHDVSNTEDMESYINLAQERNIGYVYITSDVMNNPWDALPTYWEEEIGYVKGLAIEPEETTETPTPAPTTEEEIATTEEKSLPDTGMYNEVPTLYIIPFLFVVIIGYLLCSKKIYDRYRKQK
jgi:hypothetical protein